MEIVALKKSNFIFRINKCVTRSLYYHKVHIFFTITLLFKTLTSFAQYTGKEKLKNSLNNDSITRSLLETILKNVQCPHNSNTEPQVIVMLGVIEIDSSGNLIRVFQLNNGNYETFKEFEKAVHKLNPVWNNTLHDTAYVIIPVEFRNIPDDSYQVDYSKMPDYFSEPIICLFQIYPSGFQDDKCLIDKYEKYLKKQKYKMALNEINLLLNRQPFKEILYLKKIRVLTYMGYIKEAEIETKKYNTLFNKE